MAKIIEGYSTLHKDFDKHMNKVKVGSLLAIVSLLLAGWKGFFFFVMLLIIIFCLYEYSKANEFRSGVIGERTIKRVCRRLPDRYTVITNVELAIEGRAILYDSIIVGPAGIYVVEVKNMNGTIIGDGYSSELIQHKVGRKGGRYSNRVRNPIKSVGAQVHNLSSLLKHHNLGIWVSGIVFFTNHQATVKVSNSSVPLLTLKDKGAKQLKNLLLQAESNQQHISEQAQQKAISILTGQTP